MARECEGPAKSAKFKTHEVGGGGVSATGIPQWDRVAANESEQEWGTSTAKIKLWYRATGPLCGTQEAECVKGRAEERDAPFLTALGVDAALASPPPLRSNAAKRTIRFI